MDNVILTDAEKARLDRILAVSNLRAQRRMAYPFWILGAVFISIGFAGPLFGNWDTTLFIGFGFAAVMIGMARFGYYSCFRMIHYLASSERRDPSPSNTPGGKPAPSMQPKSSNG
tara:strand:- start:1734 stop:2078 length:345 start_codon:yes stop_codon:yes gene_type:complete